MKHIAKILTVIALGALFLPTQSATEAGEDITYLESPITVPGEVVPEPKTIDELLAQYWPQEVLPLARRVMVCESGGRAFAHNNNPRTGDDSYGLFQINRFGKLANTRPAAEWLLDPENNIKYAASLYGWHGWTPWATTMRKISAGRC